MHMTWRLELLSAICIVPPFPSDVARSAGRARDDAVVSHTADVDIAIVEHEMAEPAANADRDAALRELFGLDVSADALLQQELRASQARASRVLPPSPAIAGSSGDLPALFCPVPGCARAHGNGPAWGSRDALRAHVDLHLVGELRGRPSDAWLESLQLRCCRVCGKSISRRIASMVHPRCWPQERLYQREIGLITPAEVSIEDLPSLHDIFTSPIYSKEQLPAELWPLLREEYGKLLARNNCFAEITAWDPLPTHLGGAANGSDDDAKKQTRRAWLELLMFPKTVLR